MGFFPLRGAETVTPVTCPQAGPFYDKLRKHGPAKTIFLTRRTNADPTVTAPENAPQCPTTLATPHRAGYKLRDL